MQVLKSGIPPAMFFTGQCPACSCIVAASASEVAMMPKPSGAGIVPVNNGPRGVLDRMVPVVRCPTEHCGYPIQLSKIPDTPKEIVHS